MPRSTCASRIAPVTGNAAMPPVERSAAAPAHRQQQHRRPRGIGGELRQALRAQRLRRHHRESPALSLQQHGDPPPQIGDRPVHRAQGHGFAAVLPGPRGLAMHECQTDLFSTWIHSERNARVANMDPQPTQTRHAVPLTEMCVACDRNQAEARCREALSLERAERRVACGAVRAE